MKDIIIITIYQKFGSPETRTIFWNLRSYNNKNFKADEAVYYHSTLL